MNLSSFVLEECHKIITKLNVFFRHLIQWRNILCIKDINVFLRKVLMRFIHLNLSFIHEKKMSPAKYIDAMTENDKKALNDLIVLLEENTSVRKKK